MKIAVYPGSFDPVTNGHLDIIERASRLFDVVYVAISSNPEKNHSFSVGKRVNMLKSSVKGFKNVKVETFTGLLVDYAKTKKARSIIRGLRAVSDFEYEFQLALTNRKLAPEIETIFFMTDYKFSYLSSSLVKQIAGLGGDVRGLVPKGIEKELSRKEQ
ncbi:MAG: pantetheine-phosphate adenylyltransferase [Candidatus Saganbacteria bacterium]|nr:pantetheine-phosphate adenylyltransferase [Candidatus Saganbacteria bacterium]